MTNKLKENSLFEKPKSDSSSEGDHDHKSVKDDTEEQNWKDLFESKIDSTDETSKKLNNEGDKKLKKDNAVDKDSVDDDTDSDDYSDEDSSEEVKLKNNTFQLSRTMTKCFKYKPTFFDKHL